MFLVEVQMLNSNSYLIYKLVKDKLLIQKLIIDQVLIKKNIHEIQTLIIIYS